MLDFLEAGYGNMLLAAICILGMAGTWIAGRRYRRLALDMDNLSGSQNKYVKQLKNRFETSYRINQGVNNVGLFVERNVQGFRFMGIRLRRLEDTAARAGNLVFLLGCGAALFCYQEGMSWPAVALNLAFSLFFSAVALVYWKNADVRRRAHDFYIHIQDYLENVLSNRLAATAPTETAAPEKYRENGGIPDCMDYGNRETSAGCALPEPSAGDRAEKSYEEEISYLKQSLDRIASGREPEEGGKHHKRRKVRLSREEQDLIEDILREYFA